MIELERRQHNDPTGFYGAFWTDEANEHVIAEEGGQYWVRDENGDVGVANDLATAFDLATAEWGEVALADANRLRRNVEEGRSGEVDYFLLEYLAAYGTAGIDAQALARRVFERIEEE